MQVDNDARLSQGVRFKTGRESNIKTGGEQTLEDLAGFILSCLSPNPAFCSSLDYQDVMRQFYAFVGKNAVATVSPTALRQAKRTNTIKKSVSAPLQPSTASKAVLRKTKTSVLQSQQGTRQAIFT